MNAITTPSISPFLFCADVEKSLDFLVSAFGLEPGAANPEPDGTIGHATASLGSATVFLSRPHAGALEPPGSSAVLHSLVLAYVPDVDAVFERARAAGASVEYKPQDMPYGQRECGIRDLDRHLWCFATPLDSTAG